MKLSQKEFGRLHNINHYQVQLEQSLQNVTVGLSRLNGQVAKPPLWGHDDLVTNAHSALKPVEVQYLSTVVVEQYNPDEAEILAFLLHQIRNTEEIFELNRIRSAERRLLMLMRWLGIHFSQVSSRGYRLSLKEMNLTNRSLAEICGLSRVTVTKNLNRYKTLGLLHNVGEADLFIPGEALASAF